MINAFLVDDEYFVRKGLISVLPWNQYGIQVVGEAGNGMEALKTLNNHDVDLLITDLVMPVMSGIDLMKKVKIKFPHIYIVVLTCHDDFEYIQKSLRIGAIDYIVKTELEKGMLEESLNRISSRISLLQDQEHKGEKRNIHEKHWNEETEEIFWEQIDEWKHMYWVIDHQIFHQLLDTIKELDPPAHNIQKFGNHLFLKWRKKYGKDFTNLASSRVEELRNYEDWCTLVEQLKRELQDTMKVEKYPKDIVERILKAVEIIQDHTDIKITQDYLASHLKMNRSYFSLCFQDILGITFHRYITRVRITRAKELLAQTSKPIMIIAEECGFHDHRYFSRLFRKEVGKLPSEYRKIQS